MVRILVVDDEAAIRKALERFLTGLSYDVSTASNGEEAIKIAKADVIDLALIDLVMPKMDGIELIGHLKRMQPEIVTIVLTGFGTITSAVEAMKVGAYHYLTKPFELDDIASLVLTALEHSKLKEENRLLKGMLREKYRFENIIGTSDEMIAVFDMIERVASTDSTVLITGESGTGKELVARAIHYNSPRRERTMVTVNCAAIPEELLESELFGHVRGAFTGAVATRAGRFDAADGGTLFLDEIGDMTLKLQVKVLRVLQEQSFEPIGSTTTREVDVRIIAATNQNLEEAVARGRFREDLYYRLNVIPIRLPPLRERPDDIPMLVEAFLKKHSAEASLPMSVIDPQAMEAMTRYAWPGNVRELQNVIERMVVFKKGKRIVREDLPPDIGQQVPHKESDAGEGKDTRLPEEGISFKKAVAEFETNLILRALARSVGNKNKAAGFLKLNRTTLVEKMKKRKIHFKLPPLP